MERALTSFFRGTAIAVLCYATAGCSSVFDSDTVEGTVRFTAGGSGSSASLLACAEADVVRLSFTPRGEAARERTLDVDSGAGCAAEFSIKVPKGGLALTGELAGGGRPLMRGTRSGYSADRDGFVVEIDLAAIEALEVLTSTVGLGGPDAYMLEIDGNAGSVMIAKDAEVMVAGLAAGPRFVTIHAEPCLVVDGLARRELVIPSDESERGAARFEIDCSQPGNVQIVTETWGFARPPEYTVRIGDMPAQPVPKRGLVVIDEVTPGPMEIWLETGDPRCVPEHVTKRPFFLPAGGERRVEFLVRCVSGGSGAPPPIQYGTLRVVARQHQPPGPKEIPTFDAIVTDAASQVQQLGVAVGDSVDFVVRLDRSPFDVTLAATGSCFVHSGPPSQTVSGLTGGFARVVFDVGC